MQRSQLYRFTKHLLRILPMLTVIALGFWINLVELPQVYRTKAHPHQNKMQIPPLVLPQPINSDRRFQDFPQPTIQKGQVTGTVYEFNGVDSTEGEAIFAMADAAVYFQNSGIVRLLLSAPEQFEGKTLSKAVLRGPSDTTEFLKQIEHDFPGYKDKNYGDWLIKLPSLAQKKPSVHLPGQHRSFTVDPRQQSVVLYEDFENGLGQWDYSNNSYSWTTTTCGAWQGQRSADPIRGGDQGTFLGCGGYYPNNVENWLEYRGCLDLFGASQAWLDFYFRCQLESAADTDGLAVYCYDPDSELWWGWYYYGAWANWHHAHFNLKQWYYIGDLTQQPCSLFAMSFFSDSSVTSGFGAQVDEVTIRKNLAPSLGCTIIPSTYSGPAPLTVNLTANLVGASGSQTYRWKIGEDGDWTESSFTPNLTVTLRSAGEIPVFLSVNDGNRSCTSVITIRVLSQPCNFMPIRVGQTLNGSIASSDCELSQGRYSDAYTFSGSQGQKIAVSMASNSFDTFLYLTGPNGFQLENDDGGDGINSRIPNEDGFLALPITGTYTIWATSYDPDSTGAYLLQLMGDRPPDPPTACGTATDIQNAIQRRLELLSSMNPPDYLPSQAPLAALVLRKFPKLQVYDEYYYSALERRGLVTTTLAYARKALERGDLITACKFLEKSGENLIQMTTAEAAAAKTWQENVVFLQEVLKEISTTSCGIVSTGFKAGVIGDAGCLLLDYSLDEAIYGREAVYTRIRERLLSEVLIKVVFNVPLRSLNGNTLSDFLSKGISHQIGNSGIHKLLEEITSNPQTRIALIQALSALGESEINGKIEEIAEALLHSITETLFLTHSASSYLRTEFLLKQEVEPLQVIETFPDLSAAFVPLEIQKVSIRFNKPVKLGTSTIQIVDQTGTSIPILETRTINDVLEITLGARLSLGNCYTILVNSGTVLTYEGSSNAAFQWKFSTPQIPLQTGIKATVSNTGFIGLNLRSSPRYLLDGSNVIRALNEGTVVRIIGGPVMADGFTWWQVKENKQRGWLAIGDWLRPIDSGGIRPGATVTVSNTGGAGLRLRQLPGINSPQIANLPDGTILNLISGPYYFDGYLWWAVRTNSQVGFCAVAYWLSAQSNQNGAVD